MDELHASRLRGAVFSLLGVLTAASLLGTALSPYLLVKSPLLLVAISPAAHHVALASATTEPLPLIAVATLRRALTGVGTYGIGYLYGSAALNWLNDSYPRIARLAAWLERVFQRFGVGLLVLAPAPSLALFAGSARSRFSAFLVALTLGHALWNSLAYFVGSAISAWTDVLTDFIGENLLESTLVCLAAVALQQGISRAVRRRPA